ncbi:MAG: CPBP family glutamic-type intramembrane protease, partial [Verrucomicrobiota bacterium]
QRLRRGWALPQAIPPTELLLAMGMFTGGILAFGLGTGFLSWKLTDLSGREFVQAVVILFVFPGIAEEFVFRGLLLPARGERGKSGFPWWLLAGNVVVFALWHVVNAWAFFPDARPVFWDARFLVLAGWLGAACAWLYLRSGSLYPAIFLHWITVVLWKAFLDGPVFFE